MRSVEQLAFVLPVFLGDDHVCNFLQIPTDGRRCVFLRVVEFERGEAVLRADLVDETPVLDAPLAGSRIESSAGCFVVLVVSVDEDLFGGLTCVGCRTKRTDAGPWFAGLLCFALFGRGWGALGFFVGCNESRQADPCQSSQWLCHELMTRGS